MGRDIIFFFFGDGEWLFSKSEFWSNDFFPFLGMLSKFHPELCYEEVISVVNYDWQVS